MTIFFSVVVGLFVTLVAIPPLMALAPKLGLVDLPGPRKVHSGVIPRCGGLAIVPATLLPVLMWAPADPRLISYVGGAIIVAAFGILDDLKPLNYKWKLLGQAVAVAVAMQGGIVLSHLPFFGLDPAPVWIAYPITALFLLGITNAVNLFDGLDGLAGGFVVLSLSTIALLAFEAQGFAVMLTCVAATGAVFGFLRYNTYPASVFMGDGGSQFLGFTAAVLAVLLVETCNPALNPAILLFLLGLPILDTLTVMGQRLLDGRSPFSSDRNHIHHKLIALGFRHYEAVAVIYIIQIAFLAWALALRYASDTVVLSIFVAMCAAVLAPLYILQMRGWRRHPATPEGRFVERRNLWLRRREWLPSASMTCLRFGIAGFLILAACLPVDPSMDVAILSFAGFGVPLAAMVMVKPKARTIANAGVFVACAVAAYQVAVWRYHVPEAIWFIVPYLTALAVVLALSFRLTRRDDFRVTTQDLLVLFLALAVPNLSPETVARYSLGTVAAVMVLLFYASAFSVTRDPKGRQIVVAASLGSLAIISVRGLFM